MLLQDLGYFLVMYSLAVVAGLYHRAWFKWTLAAALIVGYALYVYRHFTRPGEKTEENPWQATTLEWAAPSPPPHGNFLELPQAYRGPYEYSVPGAAKDFSPQYEA